MSMNNTGLSCVRATAHGTRARQTQKKRPGCGGPLSQIAPASFAGDRTTARRHQPPHRPRVPRDAGICARRAVEIVQRDRKASTSYLQRRLQIGYNRAATLIEKMEKAGIISEANAAGKRDILVDVVDED